MLQDCINLHFGLVELHLVQLLPVASHFALQLVRLNGSLSQSVQLVAVGAGCTGVYKQLGVLVKVHTEARFAAGLAHTTILSQLVFTVGNFLQ